MASAAANAVGKTHLIAAYGVYFMDAVGSQIDPKTNEPQGALWIMTAPGISNIDNLWAEAQAHMRNARRLGFEMGGFYSDRSVKWLIREDWKIEAISPPRAAEQKQAHAGAGRHHRNLLITIDEAAGVDRPRYRAAEGVASGDRNKIVLTFNPTEVASPAKDAYDGAQYTRHRISAFNHPNIRERREVVEGAIGIRATEARILDWCDDLGPYIPGQIEPDEVYKDFIWRMHPLTGTDDANQIPEPRPTIEKIDVQGVEYEVLGHEEGELRVYRPDYRFLPTVLGLFPTSATSTLFPEAALQKAVEAWQNRLPPEGPPDQVGLDPAEEGGDEPMAIPAWITPAGRLITPEGRSVPKYRYYLGRPKPLRPGLPSVVAGEAWLHCGAAPIYVVDAIGVGSGVEDNLNVDYGAKTFRFKSSHTGAIGRLPDEPEFLNRRAAAYWHFSMLVRRGLVALPPDASLLKQLAATTYDFQQGKVRIISKLKLKEVLGSSPDRADAAVLAVARVTGLRTAGSDYMPMGGRKHSEVPDFHAYYATRGSRS